MVLVCCFCASKSYLQGPACTGGFAEAFARIAHEFLSQPGPGSPATRGGLLVQKSGPSRKEQRGVHVSCPPPSLGISGALLGAALGIERIPKAWIFLGLGEAQMQWAKNSAQMLAEVLVSTTKTCQDPCAELRQPSTVRESTSKFVSENSVHENSEKASLPTKASAVPIDDEVLSAVTAEILRICESRFAMRQQDADDAQTPSPRTSLSVAEIECIARQVAASAVDERLRGLNSQVQQRPVHEVDSLQKSSAKLDSTNQNLEGISQSDLAELTQPKVNSGSGNAQHSNDFGSHSSFGDDSFDRNEGYVVEQRENSQSDLAELTPKVNSGSGDSQHSNDFGSHSSFGDDSYDRHEGYVVEQREIVIDSSGVPSNADLRLGTTGASQSRVNSQSGSSGGFASYSVDHDSHSDRDSSPAVHYTSGKNTQTPTHPHATKEDSLSPEEQVRFFLLARSVFC